MERDILFRGKRGNGKWVYGSLVMSGDFCPAIYYPKESEGLVKQFDWCYVHYDTIGQYTGLKDKNGKEIFEGDIIRVSEYENILTGEFNDAPDRFDQFTLDEIKGDLRQSYTSPVEWEEGTFCISTKSDWLHHNDMFLAVLFGDMKRSNPIFDFEVIGNIHDNPDLIK